jgi:hypothetical protein
MTRHLVCAAAKGYHRLQMNVGLEPNAWQGFFGAVAAASAALAGLFFVAISLRPNEISSHPVLRYRARSNLQNLLLILATSLVVLIPGQSSPVLGVELLLVMVLLTALGITGAVEMYRRADRVLAGVHVRLAIALLSSAFALGAGISLIVGSGPGLYLEVPSIVFALPASGWMAWQVVFPPEQLAKG